MNDLKFVTHFSICNMENIIRKTVQEEVEKCLSPTSAKPSRKRSETIVIRNGKIVWKHGPHLAEF